MKKALVIGINGMDGRTITEILLKLGYIVVGTYRRNTINIKEIHEQYNKNANLIFEYCDINDFESVKNLILKHQDTNKCFLLAAQSHVGFSFNSPSETVWTNGMSAFNFLENIKNINKTIKLYGAATSELFGGLHETPTNELSEFNCRSPYSVGKELMTRWIKYYQQLGLFCCYGILFNHSNFLRSKDFYIRRVTNTAAKIILGKENVLELGNINFWRDEHWADFGCEMMIKMLDNDYPKNYVIGNGVAHYGEEYLDLAFGYFNLDWKKYIKIDENRFRPCDVYKLVADSSKAQLELGWKTNRMPFKTHIELMCKYDYELESGLIPFKPNIFEMFP